MDVVNPYEGSGTWLRGNLHAHTTASDGTRPPEDVVADYEARGYDFLAVSDHDALVDPGDYRDGTGMILLPAVEVSANGPHLLHLGAGEVVPPDRDRQAVVDLIRERGGLAVLNHPNWQEEFAHWPRDELFRLEGYAGIEIYNAVVEQLPGAALATDRWDQLLSAGRRVWGFASDDSHAGRDVERAWTVVEADEPTAEAVYEALASGRFYASTGVTIRDVTVAGDELTVETADARRIRLVSDYGVVQQTVEAPTASFRLPSQLVHQSDHTYVRLECLGRGGETAWTQPLFLDGRGRS